MLIHPRRLVRLGPEGFSIEKVRNIKHKYARGLRFALGRVEVVRIGMDRYSYSDGHHRVIAARHLNMPLPCQIVRDLYAERCGLHLIGRGPYCSQVAC